MAWPVMLSSHCTSCNEASGSISSSLAGLIRHTGYNVLEKSLYEMQMVNSKDAGTIILKSPGFPLIALISLITCFIKQSDTILH